MPNIVECKLTLASFRDKSLNEKLKNILTVKFILIVFAKTLTTMKFFENNEINIINDLSDFF